MDQVEAMALDNKDGFRDYLKNDLRFFNFVGNAGFYPTFSSSNFGLQDDTAVPVTSAHLNMVYLKDRGQDQDQDFSNQTVHDGIPYEVVRTSHIDLPFIDGIVEFPNSCISPIPCDHPTFLKTTRILLGDDFEDIVQENFLENSKTNSVVVHLKLYLDRDFKYSMDELDSSQFVFRNLNNPSVKIKENPFYFKVKMASVESGFKYRVDAFYSGKIKTANFEERLRSLIIFNEGKVGNTYKFFNTTVRKSYTTVIDSDFINRL